MSELGFNLPAGEAPRRVQVAVFAPLTGSYTYYWPESLGEPQRGIRVLVPFGRSRRNGMVVDIGGCGTEKKIKLVIDRLDRQPPISQSRWKWLERSWRYYQVIPGTMLELAMVWVGSEGKRRWYCPDNRVLQEFDRELAECFSRRDTLSLSTLSRHLGVIALHWRVLQASESGLLREVIPGPDDAIRPSSEAFPITLRDEQSRAVECLLKARGFSPHLLFGRTGSGKTEVYLRASEKKIRDGGQVLILVPEIGLTAQWMRRVRSRFAGSMVWHSGLSDLERRRVRAGLADVDVLLGTRSALFLPLPRLSLIVVDEEHDASFKQQDGVCYSARDMAVLLAQALNIPIVLGSATPSLESWRQCRAGNYQMLRLSESVAVRAPQLEIVDLRGGDAVLSDGLLQALADTVERGEQAMLYLNRRGYAPALGCTACGAVPECPACSLRLTLHRKRKRLCCHACGHIAGVPHICPVCGEDALMPLGEGTERIEEVLSKSLPALRCTRLDRDTATSSKRLLGILEDFAAGSIDCLIGTQMIIKGHHFPNVTLVGVVNADLGLSLPDFRAGERWWQQLTQVLGRTGRGQRPGRVIIQTRNPDAAWLRRIGDGQAEATLDEELELRRQLAYPPFGRWVRIVFSSKRAVQARQAAEAARAMFEHLPPEVLQVGPMPCAVERVAGRYRFELLLRDASRAILPWHLAPLLEALPLASAVRRRVDVDPIDMM
ncbi:MAG: primosomal protein N' [Mariprofundaceae bacterium]